MIVPEHVPVKLERKVNAGRQVRGSRKGFLSLRPVLERSDEVRSGSVAASRGNAVVEVERLSVRMQSPLRPAVLSEHRLLQLTRDLARNQVVPL